MPTKRKTKVKRKKKPISLQAVADETRGGKYSMAEMMAWYKPIKKPVTLRIDADVLAWFKKQGRRYQTRMNGVLRDFMKRHMKG